MKVIAGIVVAMLAALFGVTFVLASVQRADAHGMCLADTNALPADVAGYKGEQLVNAAAIVRAGIDLGVDQHGQVLAVMTAMGESTLRNITYGDWETSGITNPDGSRTTSIGLFQQQESWGSVQDRMDPAKSAGLFYARLLVVPGWQNMPATLAIHAVQINADPQHYARYENDATALVTALTSSCASGSGEWIVPARGKVTDMFGTCDLSRPGGDCHKGTDLADGTCGGPVWAASAGTVLSAGEQPFRGFAVWIDHGKDAEGKRIVTGYFHMESGLLVSAGAVVPAGQQIGKMSDTGFSQGCHLHFQIERDGTPINAEPFMAAAGAPLPH